MSDPKIPPDVDPLSAELESVHARLASSRMKIAQSKQRYTPTPALPPTTEEAPAQPDAARLMIEQIDATLGEVREARAARRKQQEIPSPLGSKAKPTK